jgi:cation:H+ antiporter
MSFTASLILFAGLLCLWFGSGLVVEAAKKLARKFKISLALIGLTIVSIGTSLPEIFTNVLSGIKTARGVEASGIAVGTNIGSCLTQMTLILGMTAIIGTMAVNRKMLWRDGMMVLVAIAAMFVAGLDGVVSRTDGAILIGSYLIYLVVISRDEHVVSHINREIHHKTKEAGMVASLGLMALGLGLLLVGSHWVVESALKLAEALGVAQSFIGVLIVGVGTGLPEMSTAIRGVLGKAEAMSLGTLIGSNITDPMFSLGSGALVTGLAFERQLLLFDVPYWFLVTILALFLLGRKMRIGKEDRKEGILLIGLYVVFVLLKISFFR